MRFIHLTLKGADAIREALDHAEAALNPARNDEERDAHHKVQQARGIITYDAAGNVQLGEDPGMPEVQLGARMTCPHCGNIGVSGGKGRASGGFDFAWAAHAAKVLNDTADQLQVDADLLAARIKDRRTNAAGYVAAAIEAAKESAEAREEFHRAFGRYPEE